MASILRGLSYSKLSSELPLRQVRRFPWNPYLMTGRFPSSCSNCIAPQPVVSYLYYQAVVRSKPDLTFGGVVREITGASDRSSRREARTCFRFHLVPPRKGVFVSFLDTYTRFLRSALWRVFGSSQEFKSQRDTDFEPTISTHDSHVSHVFSRT